MCFLFTCGGGWFEGMAGMSGFVCSCYKLCTCHVKIVYSGMIGSLCIGGLCW